MKIPLPINCGLTYFHLSLLFWESALIMGELIPHYYSPTMLVTEMESTKVCAMLTEIRGKTCLWAEPQAQPSLPKISVLGSQTKSSLQQCGTLTFHCHCPCIAHPLRSSWKEGEQALLDPLAVKQSSSGTTDRSLSQWMGGKVHRVTKD